MPDNSYQPKVYRQQGATAIVVASGGTILVEPGGHIDASTGRITLPAGQRRGLVQLDIFSARTLSSGEAFNSFNVSATGAALPTGSVGGLIGAGTVPFLAMNTTLNQAAHVQWVSGQTGALAFTPMAVPQDFNSSAALTIHAIAERTSDNASNNVLNFRFWAGSQTTNGGTTGSTMTTTPAEYSISVTTAHLLAHPSYWNVQLAPGTHTNNAVRLFNAWLEYDRLSS